VGSHGHRSPKSRLLIGFVVGRRNEALIKELMQSTKKRLKSPKDLVLMSDGEKSYESLFTSIFGEPYRPARKGDRGRFERRSQASRVKRSLAHLQLIKRRHQGGRVVEVRSRVAHGSWKRVNKELEKLGYHKPNLFSAPSSARTALRGGCERLFSGQEESGLREKRGEPGGGSGMVERGRLQLLPRTKRAERAILSSPGGRRRRHEHSAHLLWPRT
jgi:hypothetical protein